MKRIYVFVLPIVFVGLFQLGGCSRTSVTPAQPGGVYRSASAGASFEQSVDIAGEVGEYIATFQLQEISRSPRDANTIFIAAGRKGIVRSVDDGQTWEVIATPLALTIDVLQLENGALVASGSDGDGQGFIIRSLDEGKSWHSVFTVPIPIEKKRLEIIKGGSNDTLASIVISIHPDPFNPDRIYAGSNLGTLFLGEQSAKTWSSFHTLANTSLSPTANKQQSILKVIPSPHENGELLLITTANELIRLQDGKQEEIKVPERIEEDVSPIKSRGTKEILDASYIDSFPDALIVGAQDGVAVTRDNGQTWIQLSVPIETTQNFNSMVVNVSPTNVNRIIVAINSVIYRSEDGGNSWNTFPLGLPGHAIIDLSINPSNAAKVLLVTTPLKT